MMYKKITVDGTITEAKKMTLEEMQDFIGGYIQYVPKSMKQGHFNIICNEEGLNLGLPTNKLYPMFVGNIILEEKSKRANKAERDVR
ncbi:MAG: DUF3846 domain-containing protein [Nitrospirae bacterium]|nr:MAG: DUF3846 domain-containing protein [Nitrospirota bacterium]